MRNVYRKPTLTCSRVKKQTPSRAWEEGWMHATRQGRGLKAEAGLRRSRPRLEQNCHVWPPGVSGGHTG